MANPFDIFDAPASANREPNPFDIFDGSDGTASAPGALNIRVGAKPAPTVPNPFEAGQAGAPTTSRDTFDARFYGAEHGIPPMASKVDIRSPMARPLEAQAAGIRAKEDERLVGAPSFGNDVLTAALSAGQGASLNLMGNAAAGVATGLGALGAPGYSPRPFSENYRRFKDMMAAHERQSPKSAIAGTVGGVVAGIPLMPGLVGAPAAKFGARVIQNAVTGAGYGAAGEYLDSKDGVSAAKAGVVGGALGGTLGAAVEKAVPSVVKGADAIMQKLGLRVAPAPRTTLNADETAALQAAGTDPAQITGDMTKRFLDAFQAKGVSPAVVREAQAAEFGIPLSRGQATGNAGDIALEQGALSGRKGPRAQEIGQDFEATQTGARISARDVLTQMLAGNRPAIDNATAASEGIADAARRARDDIAFRSSSAQRQADQALEGVRGRGLPPDPIETANILGQSLREAAGEGKAAYRAAYDEVAQIPGQFTPGALDRMGTRVRDRLGAEYPIDPVLTPAASRAVSDLDSLPGIFGLEVGQGPNLQQVDQLRKRLVAYRSSTGQNPTDRRAMDKLLREFDGHVEDAMSVGQFGQQAPARAPAAPVDDFPGFAPSGVPDPAAVAPGASQAVPRGRQSEPESLVDYLSRNGGIPLDDEARAADLHRAYMPGRGTLARRDAPTWDQVRVRMAEEGFLSPDEMGAASARDVADKVRDLIQAERVGGRKTYRMEDEGRATGTRRNMDRISDENADHLAQVDRQARRIAIDMEGHGLRAGDLDREALNDAAAMMLRGEADDAAHAYDRAVMRRAEGDFVRPSGPAPRSDDAPFPELGEGFAPASADMTGGLPIGDTAPAEAMRRARGLFRDYRQAFSPRGPGDDAGIAMRKIVDRDATPNEIASALYGGTRAGTTGLSVRIHDRLRETLPEGHPAFAAIQQGLVSKVVDGGPGDVAARLDHLLNGEGRTLAAKVLTPEQRAGLEAFRAGSIQARNASEAVPDWVRRLSDTGFDPNRVTADLFGSGIPGARPGQPAFAKGLKSFLGADSPEWSNVRQAAWLRLVQHGEGAPISPTKEAARIRAFTEGEGKGMAAVMFTPGELAAMNRYADAVRITELPKGQRLPDGGKSAALASHAMNLIAGTIGFKIGGPAAGVAAYGAKVGQKALQGGLTAARASRSFGEGAPHVALPLPAYVPRAGARAAVGSGYFAPDLAPARR